MKLTCSGPFIASDTSLCLVFDQPTYHVTMPDYAKLKVTELKEDLGKRGLPKAGLKAELVRRLVEADANAQQTEADSHADNDEGDVAPVEASSHLHSEAAEEKIGTSAPTSKEEAPKKSEVNGHHGESSPSPQVAQTEERSVTSPGTGAQPQDPAVDNVEPSVPKDPELARLAEESNTESTVLAGTPTQPVDVPEQQLPTPIQTQSLEVPLTSTQSSITPEEILEDSKKRKRRSQSPPPSSFPVSQKKLKSDDDDPSLKESLSLKTIPPASDSTFDETKPQKDEDSGAEKLALKSDREATEEASLTKVNGSGAREPSEAAGKPSPSNKPVKTDQKSSSKEHRFKDLINPPSETVGLDPEQVSRGNEEQDVSPSIHPATSSLYIRELMRPLNPKAVREHLLALAAPPDTDTDPSIITEFFLDSIRTHCLVTFATTAAASRVRSSLHDRVWPNERDRRALWVDFVPEEKLQKWIEVEQDSSGGRGQASKRWEVTYEDEDGEIKAYLQEAGATKGGLRTAQMQKADDTGSNVKRLGGPTGPDRIIAAPRDDHGKGFQALDDLFKSTKAKPKLYYLPVSKKDVDRRLHLLGAGRGGGRDDEMRRFSFEDDMVVDKGPEFGMRGRGGRRGGRPGPPDSTYRGRGGSFRGEGRYRGDAHRDGGDTYRRPGYH